MTSRFYGNIGFASDAAETFEGSGVIEEAMVERSYYGHLVRPGVNARDSGVILPDIDTGIQFSVLGDPYAYEHIYAIRYLIWQNTYWTVKKVDIMRPRLLILVGGVYGGPKAPASKNSGTPNAGV